MPSFLQCPEYAAGCVVDGEQLQDTVVPLDWVARAVRLGVVRAAGRLLVPPPPWMWGWWEVRRAPRPPPMVSPPSPRRRLRLRRAVAGEETLSDAAPHPPPPPPAVPPPPASRRRRARSGRGSHNSPRARVSRHPPSLRHCRRSRRRSRRSRRRAPRRHSPAPVPAAAPRPPPAPRRGSLRRPLGRLARLRAVARATQGHRRRLGGRGDGGRGGRRAHRPWCRHRRPDGACDSARRASRGPPSPSVAAHKYTKESS